MRTEAGKPPESLILEIGDGLAGLMTDSGSSRIEVEALQRNRYSYEANKGNLNFDMAQKNPDFGELGHVQFRMFRF